MFAESPVEKKRINITSHLYIKKVLFKKKEKSSMRIGTNSFPEGKGSQFEQRSCLSATLNKPHAHSRLVVWASLVGSILPPAWCLLVCPVSFCACALRRRRLAIIYQPSADGCQAIVRPDYYNKPPAGRHHYGGLLSVAVGGAGRRPRRSFRFFSVLHLRCVINICCLVAVSMDWLRTSAGFVLINDLFVLSEY